MKIDVSVTPFSKKGSYMCFSIVPPEWGHKGLLVRSVYGSSGYREAFRMIMVKNGKELNYTVDATPWQCVLKNGKNSIELTFADLDAARVRGKGVTLRLLSIPEKGQYAFPAGEKSWHVNSSGSANQYLFTALKGEIKIKSNILKGDFKRGKKAAQVKETQKVTADFVPGKDGRFECTIEEFVTTPDRKGQKGTYEDCMDSMKQDWEKWVKTMPSLPASYEKAGEMAMWVNYESMVAPRENFRRPTMLMSKNWMTSCWSWDHCFNAMAHSYTDPDTAWDQLNVHFDLQDEYGCLPDGVKTGSMGWNFCKPPIHGWALSKMMKNKDLLSRKRLKAFYPKLSRWTEWWLKHRDYDGDGLCEYHHGNDSGWDNSTVFDGGFPVAGADLAAFLILQMDMLSVMAGMLKKKKDLRKWKKRADRMQKRMIDMLWDGDQFRSKKAFTFTSFPNGDSLINYLPIILGKRLPREIRDKVAEGLKPDGRFVTKYGPATENPKSPLYIESGYWRGPIWGPEAVIICDGLNRGGYKAQAKEIAKRYCNMCRKSNIFAENYDPLSGEPLCDKAYTWGSSSFLVLAHELLK